MPNGAIYIFKVNDFNKEKNFPTKNVFPFLMSDIESIDIDSIKDLRLVRKILQKK
jgi:N-acylneuraminate cytidylyltransferase